ncbi:hypothetical protein HY571_01715 [Candidatus Micrarchaeota archaeon]|nr:hypothetical protein [Candidatus Micrarchaeota archaeon]
MEFNRETIGYLVIAVLAVFFALAIGFELGSQNQPTQVITRNASLPATQAQAVQPVPSAPLERITLSLPGVTPDNRGITTSLTVERINGSGRAFINIGESQPSLSQETQGSFQNAVRVARRFDQEATRRFATSDVLYSFGTETEGLAGSSAGAAMAVATIALLKGQELNTSVAITGSVNTDGAVGKVGGIVEKAHALRRQGVRLFLIPPGESITENVRVYNVEVCTEQQLSSGVLRNCHTERRLEISSSNVTAESGISVAEVSSVADAYALMVKQR